jgi:hypothetical protein
MHLESGESFFRVRGSLSKNNWRRNRDFEFESRVVEVRLFLFLQKMRRKVRERRLKVSFKLFN